MKAVFFDRDGVLNIPSVLNGKPYAPRKFIDFKIYDGVKESLEKIKSAGFFIVVITNQPDIGNGLVDIKEINVMHEFLKKELPIDYIEICPHSQTSNCNCRKPKPGLIFSAVDKHKIDLSKSWLIGDRWSDIVAGVSSGLKTIFIDHKYTEKTQNFGPDYVVSTTQKACELVLSE